MFECAQPVIFEVLSLFSGRILWCVHLVTEFSSLSHVKAKAVQNRHEHVVSHHSARTIKNFLLAQMHVSAEVDDEDEAGKEKTTKELVSIAWASVDRIADLLQSEPAPRTNKKLKHADAVDRAKQLMCDIWASVEDDENELPKAFNRQGSVLAFVVP